MDDKRESIGQKSVQKVDKIQLLVGCSFVIKS